MKFRLLNRWYANFFGYFWLPCLLCGQFFGGHEWRSRTAHTVEGKAICSDCDEKGLGQDNFTPSSLGKVE